MRVIIIGAGAIGLLTALKLQQAQISVTLFEQSQTGQESSWAGGGILSPLHPWHQADAINRLAHWSQQHYPSLVELLTPAISKTIDYHKTGLLYFDSNDYTQVLTWNKKFPQAIQQLSTQAINSIEPKLAQLPESAIWMPDIAQIRNPRLTQALKQYLYQKQVKIQEQTKVSGLNITHHRITGIITTKGKYEADAVVIAAGAWSNQLLAALSLKIQTQPVRGQMLLFKAKPKWLNCMVLKDNYYLIPRQDGRILVGSTLENVGFNKQTTTDAYQALYQAAQNLIPDIRQFPVEHHWAGLRPSAPKGIPYIGEHPEVKGLYINTGHFRNGIVTAPASAQLLANLILQQPPILDPTPYAIDANRNQN